MNKKEKYINFSVEDMVNKTKIDYDGEEIIYPFLSYSLSPTHFLNHSTIHLFHISRHLKETYGVNDEELEMIWKLYINRIESFF